ncbi:MAG: hypothetical protein ACLFVU_07160 [Phycisphaerae bacterium]
MTARTINLNKDGHKYIFRYAAGREDEIVEEIMRLADDGRCALDWLDAATLSFQVTQYAAADCCRALSPEEPTR